MNAQDIRTWEPVFYLFAQGCTLAMLAVMSYLAVRILLWAMRGGDE